MPYKHKRDCPVCDKPGLRYMSDNLRQVHCLYDDERKKWLGRARFSISHKHCSGSLPACPTYTVEEMRCVRKKTCSVKQPTKAAWKVTASMLTKPCPEFNFRHKFSLLVVGPTQSGKTYFVQQILKHNRIVYEEQKSTKELKTSLGKSIRFERGVPELSENLCEINPRYNNIIILDDLMAEATDSPVVSRLFTQGRHRNASVILLLQNMFPKGKYNTDISRNAQYLALFRSPSDRKQIGIIGERMFDKNIVHFMNAYYKETEKPFGYLLVDNKPDTPADKQILADLFGECYVYHFGVNSTEPTRVQTKPVCKHSTATKTTSSRKKPVQTVTWSDVPNDVWLKYTLGAPEFLKIPEGYVIIEMYTTSRNERHKPVRGGVLINDENYWPVKLKHRSTGHIKWVNLHSDDPQTLPSNPLSRKL